VTGTALSFDVATLGGRYKQYRVVGYGARMRLQAGVSATGEVVAAVLPLKGLAPLATSLIPQVTSITSGTATTFTYANSAGPVDTLEQTLKSLGLPTVGSGNSARLSIDKLVTCPVHGTASASQVAARGLHFRAKPYEPAAAEFRRVTFEATGTDSADIGWAGSSGNIMSQQYGVDLGFMKVNGWESIAVGGNGYTPASTVGTLEVIYHLEAILNPNWATLDRCAVTASPTDPAEHAAAHRALADVKHISFADVVEEGEDMVMGAIEGQAKSAIGQGMKSLGGYLARALSLV
jgi:hypothetical protein